MSHVFQGRSAAFTLIEILWALAILGVVLNLSMGFSNIVERERRYLVQLELRRLVSYARAEAVSRGEAVTLCALDQGARCVREWSGRTVAVFADRNEDGRADDGEILRLSGWEESRGTVQWRAALGRPQLEFSPFGGTRQNGSFYLCRRGRGNPAELVLTLNRGGRPYVAETAGRRCL